ncbi:molybdopterin biosynthesis protein [Rhodobacterales bacterium HKCCSP123]|nr:molybdopterin biosynthesis protein [Rhodobacterales bacterium HKCCSP123]
MRFGPVPLDAAEGAVLAHAVALPGGRLKKGHVLRAGDVAALAAAGLAEVIVARLEPGDVGEDAAALRLANALVPEPGAAGLRLEAPFTGRVNIRATGPGVVALDPLAIARLNAVDPMITLATVPEWQRVTEGTMVGTVKIIAYAVPEAALGAACAEGAGAMRRMAPVIGDADLVVTETAPGAAKAEARALRAVWERVERLGIGSGATRVVAHRADAVAAAIGESGAGMVLILTGSATSDIGDVVPAGLRAAGGEVIRFGMPVDPGNLLVLGRQGGRPVIGLPGCARSPALNGADWVLERVACGVEVTAADIAAMGVGGLLKEIPTRPQPRERRAKP